jgi:hypothetical protein
MTVTHLDHLYRETHHWADTVTFWETLGFSRAETWGDAPHRAGRLVRGEAAIVVAEIPPESMPEASVFFAVDDVDDIGHRAGRDVVPTHWGTRMVTVTDPDGRTYNFEPRGQS